MSSIVSVIRKWLASRIDPTPPRQDYISDELSHFVGRGKSADEQFRLLVRIVESGWLSHPPHNPNISGNLSVSWGKSFDSNAMYAPEMVCFCDIPADQLAIHCLKYSPFGLSFSKRFVAERGGRPVYYVPRDGKIRTFRAPEPSHLGRRPRGPLSLENLTVEENVGAFFDQNVRELSELVQQCRSTPGVSPSMRFLDFHILSYFKFFDLHLEDSDEENFYLEREWRMIGNLRFKRKDIRRVFVRSGYATRFSKRVPSVECLELSSGAA